MSYRYDIRHLSVQTQHIINQRDKNNKILNENTTTKLSEKTVYSTSIFMKLGHDSKPCLRQASQG